MLQVFELVRILFDQVIPPDRKARWGFAAAGSVQAAIARTAASR
jgi:hypothetical protein